MNRKFSTHVQLDWADSGQLGGESISVHPAFKYKSLSPTIMRRRPACQLYRWLSPTHFWIRIFLGVSIGGYFFYFFIFFPPILLRVTLDFFFLHCLLVFFFNQRLKVFKRKTLWRELSFFSFQSSKFHFFAGKSIEWDRFLSRPVIVKKLIK